MLGQNVGKRFPAHAQVLMLLISAVPVPQRILGCITQMAERRLNPLAELDIPLDRANSVCIDMNYLRVVQVLVRIPRSLICDPYGELADMWSMDSAGDAFMFMLCGLPTKSVLLRRPFDEEGAIEMVKDLDEVLQP